MDKIQAIIAFTQTPAFGGIMAGLFLISEGLASIKSIESNSVFQVIHGLLKKVMRKQPDAGTPPNAG